MLLQCYINDKNLNLLPLFEMKSEATWVDDC